MAKAGESEEAKASAYAELSECEKYMFTMMDVTNVAAKFECMLFRAQFRSRFDELVRSIQVIEKACQELRSSERLRDIFGIILTLVNEINTGGDGTGAAGFTLDTLLKLNEVSHEERHLSSNGSSCLIFRLHRQAKAFDRKTSVLYYLVKVVKQNDESLLGFHEDLLHVNDAQLIVLDQLCADIKMLSDELAQVHETVKAEADRLEEEGLLRKPSLDDLKEQKTNVKVLHLNIPQYNQIEHLTGRTSMERFTLGAADAVGEIVRLADAVKGNYSNLLAFFGEDETMASNEFFGTMKRFVMEFGVAVEQVEKEEEAKVSVRGFLGHVLRHCLPLKSLSSEKGETSKFLNVGCVAEKKRRG